MKIVSVDTIDRGIAYAEACFETFRVIDGECFAWPAHRQRLAVGLSEFGIDLGDDDYESLYTAALDSAAQDGASDVLVRITITGGDAGWGLTNRALSPAAYIQAMPFFSPRKPARLMLKRWPFPLKEKRAKFSSDYAETLRALAGCKDIDVLFEKNDLLIAAATANLLLYRQGRWWTPLADAGVLPGVVRNHLVKAGVAHEAECPLAWLEECEALALCNSGIFLRRVVSVTDRKALDGEHPAFRELIEALAGEAGIPKDI
ncbi:Branched-chain amino acid aminotransferase/4-amino-4-deoxychorismate lyase [Mariprofundus aestuarium]|uniref:Branched-chain amino acid aminotransferase/4-amino-4-deoxychorismate lyase n=1 Tax=Mariprofundus aestuarium TaxID=1921086 RepID=A0A2K8L5K9_MARES|nr:aminotransferase class IV [Mariprofundus aestuarium]ATX79516.1 Branched-chain amino acid aminotransferase/4-amino-4-deoxychorismate lyase [Mariprofundus aestuarium]